MLIKLDFTDTNIYANFSLARMLSNKEDKQELLR